MDSRGFFRQIFSPVVILGSLGVGILLSAVTLGMLWLTRPTTSSLPPKAAELRIIAAPTETPIPLSPTPLPTPLPVDNNQIHNGGYVQVNGTGGDGLRLRFEPGLGGKIRLLGAEGEIFVVQDGPQEQDGHTWWYLVGDSDAGRSGWAASTFLQPIPEP